MGKVKQGTPCSVEGCSELAVRSFSLDKISESLQAASLALKTSRMRRAYLCQKHYKQVKKLMKKEKRIEKWRYGI